MSTEVRDAIEELDREWIGFKRDQDKYRAEQEARLDALETRAARPHLTGDLGRAPRGEAAAEHLKAFVKMLRTGEAQGLSELQAKAISVGVQADGGYAVAQDWDQKLTSFLQAAVPMRKVCRLEPAHSDKFEMILSLGGAASGWVGETGARGETASPTIASVKPAMGEIYANPFTTQRALDDLAFDVEGWLLQELGIVFADQENIAFVSGNGTDKPKGFLTGTISTTANTAAGELLQVKSGSAGAIAVDKLFDVRDALPLRHLPGAVWMMSRATASVIRKLKTTTNDYLWQSGLAAGQPDVLLGHPVVLNDSMPAPAASSHSIAFGDFKRGYVIADHVAGTRVLRDAYTNKPKVGFYTTRRVGGGVLDASAIVIHTLGT